MFFCRPSLRMLVLTLTAKVNKLMSATDNLNTAVANLTSLVTTLATSITNETTTLANQHAELLAAIANGGNNDPAIQAAADAIGAQVTALQGIADAAAKAVTDNPDPAPVTAPPAP